MANVKNNASAKETKRRLIEAAGEVFAEHGFERATIKEITDRAGASVAAVNYHFSDKQELYDQVVQYVHGACGDALYARGVEPATPAPQRLHEFVSSMLAHLLDPTRPNWHSQIKTREMQHPGAATERYIETSIRPCVAELEGIIQEIVGGPLAPVELTRVVNSVVAQCVFYAHNAELLVRLYPDQPAASESVGGLAGHITKFTLAALPCWSAGPPTTAG